jgi:hypothetical protein
MISTLAIDASVSGARSADEPFNRRRASLGRTR